MKKLVLTLAVIGCTAGAFAQGTMITIDNLNGAGSKTATSNGLFFDGAGNPFTGAMKLSLLGGANSASLTGIATVNMLYSGVPGVYLDDSFGTYNVNGVAPGGVATLQVQAWTGSANSFATAAGTEKFNAWNGTQLVGGDTFTFTQATGGGGTPPGLPKSLDGMPAMQLVIPEPSTIALAGLGAAALLIYRRRQN